MIPEAVIAMLACARIGAPHTVVFGGFSADALATPARRLPGQGRHHRPTAATAAAPPSALKPAVDEARTKTERASRKVLVVSRTGQDR